jgi:hypothetical protein
MKYFNIVALSTSLFLIAHHSASAQTNTCVSCPAASAFTFTCGTGSCSGSNGVTPLFSQGWWGGPLISTTITPSTVPTLSGNPSLGFGAQGQMECTYAITNIAGGQFSAANASYKGCSIPPSSNNKTGCQPNQFSCPATSLEEKSKAHKRQ